MSSSTVRVPNIDVGTPATPTGNCGEWEVMNVRFHGYESLPSVMGVGVQSSEFACFGHQWHLKLFPGGETGSTNGHAAVRLCHRSNEHITIDYGFRVKQSNGKGRADWCSGDGGTEFGSPPGSGLPRRCLSTRGLANFVKRSAVIESLVDGALIVEVRMKHINAVGAPMEAFVGENPMYDAILARFMDESSSDVVFEVSNESVTSTSARNTQESKRARTSTSFHAHRFILQVAGSTLGELCKSNEGMAPIPINDVAPDIFRYILYYCYGGKVSAADMNANSKAIIDAADRYGVDGLKLEAEAAFVSSNNITIDNVMDNLLYADSKNCALLKEFVVDFLVENGEEAYEKLSFDDVPGSVVKDVLAATNRKGLGSASDAPTSLGTMRVNGLRKMLHERGLDIDGSRESMIARLRED